jgi:hypothetical protein
MERGHEPREAREEGELMLEGVAVLGDGQEVNGIPAMPAGEEGGGEGGGEWGA